jgi:Tfp pilus assembly protein PilN
MTVQFNLLPDIKIDYLKAKRQQHMVVLVSVLAGVVAISVFVLLISVVYGLQKKNLNDLNTDIKSSSKELQNTKDLNKILTVQNQLKALPALHDSKLATSRLYDYFVQATPVDASLTNIDADFTLNTMTISGAAKDLTTVNTYVDTLKFTKYTTKNQTSGKNAFSDVVLSGFNRDNKSATFTISLKFDPIIFSNTETVELTIPQTITTRSEVDKPGALFQEGDQ